MSHPASQISQISQPNQAIYIEILQKIQSLIILSSNPEHQWLLQGLKGIVYEIAMEASHNFKKTHKHLQDDDFSDLKNLGIYLKNIKNFKNHQNLLQSCSLEELASFLNIKNFTNTSYSYKILSSLIDPASFSSFAHLDKILRAFAKISGGIRYEEYIKKIIDGETFTAWHRVFTLEKLAPLFNMKRQIFAVLRTNNPSYNNQNHSDPKMPAKMKESATKGFYNEPLNALLKIENRINSSLDPEQKQRLEGLRDIVSKIGSELDKEALNNSKNTHKKLNDNDFSDLKNLSIYLQKIKNFENHKNLLETCSLKELVSFLKIKKFTESSYSYKILNALEVTANFSALSQLDKILEKFQPRPYGTKCSVYIEKRIDSETFKIWNRALSAKKLASLLYISSDTLGLFIKNNPSYNNDPSAPINDPPDNQINPNQEISSHQAPSINPSNVNSTQRLLQDYDFEQMNKWLDNISDPVLPPDSFSPMAANHFNPLTLVTPPSNLKDKTLPFNLSSGLDFDRPERDCFFSNRKTNGNFLTTEVSKNVFGDPYSADEFLNGKRTYEEVDKLPDEDEIEGWDEVKEFLNRKYPWSPSK